MAKNIEWFFFSFVIFNMYPNFLELFFTWSSFWLHHKIPGWVCLLGHALLPSCPQQPIWDTSHLPRRSHHFLPSDNCIINSNLLQQQSHLTPRVLLLLLLLYFHSDKQGICVFFFLISFFWRKFRMVLAIGKTKFKKSAYKLYEGLFWVKEYAKVCLPVKAFPGGGMHKSRHILRQ